MVAAVTTWMVGHVSFRAILSQTLLSVGVTRFARCVKFLKIIALYHTVHSLRTHVHSPRSQRRAARSRNPLQSGKLTERLEELLAGARMH